MMEQGVSNLQRSEFHSPRSWEKYIIHSSLTIKWSSAFSFLPVLCTNEKLGGFFLFLSFPCWKHCWVQSWAWPLPMQRQGSEGQPEPPSPHLGQGNRDICYELTTPARADGISASKQQTEGVQETGQGTPLPQTTLKSEILVMHFKVSCLKHLQEHRLGVFAGSPPSL